MGVGIPLGLAVIGVLGFLVWQNHRQRKRIQALQDRSPEHTGTQEQLMYNYPNGYHSQVPDQGPSELLANSKLFEAPLK